jgi:hypothetical protein
VLYFVNEYTFSRCSSHGTKNLLWKYTSIHGALISPSVQLILTKPKCSNIFPNLIPEGVCKQLDASQPCCGTTPTIHQNTVDQKIIQSPEYSQARLCILILTSIIWLIMQCYFIHEPFIFLLLSCCKRCNQILDKNLYSQLTPIYC